MKEDFIVFEDSKIITTQLTSLKLSCSAHEGRLVHIGMTATKETPCVFKPLLIVTCFSMFSLARMGRWHGSSNDRRIIKNSPFQQATTQGLLLNGLHFIDGNFNVQRYILCDEGYVLKPWIVISYEPTHQVPLLLQPQALLRSHRCGVCL